MVMFIFVITVLKPIPVWPKCEELMSMGTQCVTESKHLSEPEPDWIESLKKLTGFDRIGRIFTGILKLSHSTYKSQI